jgi:ferredoxin, 2Fe-2S
MVKITYIAADGGEQTVEAKVGHNLMETAVKSGMEGIIGECGGSCACGTCRIYVPENWRRVTGEASEMERGMLDFVEDDEPTARLSCQIVVSEELDGLVVRTAESQL